MLRLSQETINLINSRPDVLGGLASTMDRGIFTIQKWLRENDIMLTTADSLEYLHKSLGVSKSELLTKITEPKLHITNPVK